MPGELIAGAAAGLTRPATVLIERVSDAVGGIARPHQIKRVARAEAERALILARSEIEVTDLERRAAFRWLQEETKNQENIESITHQALPRLNEEAEPDKIEDDFLRNFFDKCRIVSDEQMQDVWASILAGEANNPGTFSRKTINILADMDKSDAEQFASLLSFSWVIATRTTPLVYTDDAFFGENGIDLEVLADLESLGLISFDSLPFGFNLSHTLFRATYFDRSVEVGLKTKSKNFFSTGNIIPTPAGRQLGSICRVRPIDGFFDFMCKKWREDDTIESVRVLG